MKASMVVVTSIASLLLLGRPLPAKQDCVQFWETWQMETCAGDVECFIEGDNQSGQIWIDGVLKCNGRPPDKNLFKCGGINVVKELRLEDCSLSNINMKELVLSKEPSSVSIYYGNSRRDISINADFSNMSALRAVSINGFVTADEFKLTFDRESKVKVLKIHSHGITGFPRTFFSEMPFLKALIVENGLLQRLESWVFWGLESLSVLSLAGNRIVTIEPKAFSKHPSLHWLNLAKNRLSSLNNISADSFINLQFADLSYNNLQQLPTLLLSLRGLKVVDLQGNNLSLLPSSVVNASLSFKMTLSKNSWKCECEACSTLKWMKNNSAIILDYYGITCDKQVEKKVLKFNLNSTQIEQLCGCAVPTLFSALKLSFVLIPAVLLPFFALLFAYLYRNYRLKPTSMKKSELVVKERKMYDAFVWHHDTDKKFVNAMINRLEPEHRLFLHQRDWLSYEYSRDKVMYSMENSNLIILIISRSFLSSDLFQVHFRSLYHEVPSKRKFIVPIFLPDVTSEKLLPSEFRHMWYMSNRLRWNDKSLWKKLILLLDSKYADVTPD